MPARTRSRAQTDRSVVRTNCADLVGTFPQLEDQLTGYSAGSSGLPDRLDAMVWAMTELALNAQRPQFIWGGVGPPDELEIARRHLSTDHYHP